MRIFSKKFHAVFSAPLFQWTLYLDDCEIKVTYLRIPGEKAVHTQYQEIFGEEVELNFVENQVFITKWKKLTKKHRETLYDPDKPRNLAKSVTVR